MENRVLEPGKTYSQVRGDAPDLMVYFGNLDWRSAGTVGHDSVYLSENDTGPDDSVHSMDGVLVLFDPRRDLGGREAAGARAQDVGATILAMMGVDHDPGDVPGRPIAGLLEGAP